MRFYGKIAQKKGVMKITKQGGIFIFPAPLQRY